VRVHTNSPEGVASGPNVFIRLYRRFSNHKFVDGDCDVLFVVTGCEVQHRKRFNHKKIVTRCDGLYYIGSDLFKLNVPAIERYRIADAIVFQSLYAKRFYDLVCGDRSVPSVIILNGSDMTFSKGRSPGVLISTDVTHPKKQYSKRQHLVSVVAKALVNSHPNVPVVVVGEYKGDVVRNMFLLGRRGANELAKIYSRYTTFLDLGYQPCCSNAIVEATVSGMNVVASDSGGNREILGDKALLYPERACNFRPVPRPPDPVIDKIVELVERSFTLRSKPRPDLSVKVMADKYDQFLKEVCRAA